MKKIGWGSVTKAKGWDGLNNAAINVFNSNYSKSLIRELIQNSNDARQLEKGKLKKLKVVINYKTVPKKNIPEFEQLASIIKKIARDNSDSGNSVFFSHALKSLNNRNPSIDVLEYSDYNTTGLTGSDDDETQSFNALILSEGQSKNKSGNSGGSYGIGKNSIYSCSKCRTVIYSSRNKKGENIIQGVSKLASYRENKKTFEGRIYLGSGSAFSSIRNVNLLSSEQKKLFGRDEPGLTQIALAPSKSDDWISEFTTTIIKNYWPLLDNGELEIYLKEQDILKVEINPKTFPTLLNQYFNSETYNIKALVDEAEPYGNPLDFYAAYKNGNIATREVHCLGEVSFHYLELPHKTTNRIAYIRNGMVIYSKKVHGFESIGYCGVVYCKNLEGNQLLRMMEPPTHDSFDPMRLADKTDDYSEKDGKRALNDINAHVRLELNKIVEQYRTKAEEITWLNELIQSLNSKNGNGKGSRSGEGSRKETLNRISSEKIYNLNFRSLEKNVLISPGETDTTNSGGINKGQNEAKRLKKKNPKGSEGGLNGRKKPLKFRIFRTYETKNDSSVSNTYKINIYGEEAEKNKTLFLSQAGDSGNSGAFQMLDIATADGVKISYSERRVNGLVAGYVLYDVPIPIQVNMIVEEFSTSAFSLTE